MESRQTDAPLFPDPTCSEALLAPSMHVRSHTILLFSTSAQRLWQSSGLLLAPKRHCQSAVLAVRGSCAWQNMAQSHLWHPVPGAGCSWMPGRPASPGSLVAGLRRQRGSKRPRQWDAGLCKLGGALRDSQTHVFQSGFSLGIRRWNRL